MRIVFSSSHQRSFDYNFRFIQQAVISWNKTTGLSTLYFIVVRDGIWVYALLLGTIINLL